jgi:hypothetical protein
VETRSSSISVHDRARPLRISLVVLGFVLALALTGLALTQNWGKLVRVAGAAAVYLGCLGLLVRRSTPRGEEPPWRAFATAGALAGLASGVLRPDTTVRLVVADVVGAALLLATAHWLAVRYAPRLRAWLGT